MTRAPFVPWRGRVPLPHWRREAAAAIDCYFEGGRLDAVHDARVAAMAMAADWATASTTEEVACLAAQVVAVAAGTAEAAKVSTLFGQHAALAAAPNKRSS